MQVAYQPNKIGSFMKPFLPHYYYHQLTKYIFQQMQLTEDLHDYELLHGIPTKQNW